MLPGLLLLLLGISSAFAADPASAFSSRLWHAGDGLPAGSVTAVLHSREGYIWIGTPQGIGRFDGVRCAVFNSRNTPEIKGNSVRALCQTRDGKVWIGLDNGGLTSFKLGRFEHWELPFKTPVKALLGASDGSLWVGTTNGVVRVKDGTNTWLTSSNGLYGSLVLAICEDARSNIWFGTGVGVTRYRNTFAERYTFEDGLPQQSIRSLCADSQDNIWIGTGGSGLIRLQDRKLKEFREEEGLSDGYISAILEDHRGVLWVGTMNGLFRLDEGQFIKERDGQGGPYDTVLALAEDDQGSVWMGTKEGLHQIRLKLFQTYASQQGLSHNNVMSLSEGDYGTMWLATWGGGLNRLENNQITYYNRSTRSMYDALLSVCVGRDRSIWSGGDYNCGLTRLKDGEFTFYGKEAGIVDSAIRVLCEDRAGDLWLGTSTALYRMRNGSFQRFTKADGLAGEVIRVIYEDKTGVLWIGTNEGITRRCNERFSNLTTRDGLSSNCVLAFHEDAEKNVWIGTDGGGLNRFREGRFTAYTSAHGLFSDTIFEILEDDNRNLWMSCFSGVFRIRKSDLDDLDRGVTRTIGCVSYGKPDGMLSAQCNGISKPSGWKSKDGRLWFPTTRGAVVIDPQEAVKNEMPPRVVIEEILADRINLAAFGDSDVVTAEPDRGELEIHYTALNFRFPEKNRFKYRLEGVDRDWVDAGTRRTAFYNNIPPGRYRFSVIACCSNGIWNKNGASVDLVLRPHFWQTRWFILLASLLGAGLLAGGARYLTWKRVQRKMRRLEQQHALERERSRIAQDMHDDLGTNLTQILLSTELIKRAANSPTQVLAHAEVTAGTARELIQAMDEIVWAVNPKNDNLADFAGYLFQRAERLFGMTEIRFRTDRPSDLPKRPLSADIRHNLFLTVREALNNILKHANATEVRLALSLPSETELTLTVEDNGTGFNLGSTRSYGNGLASMRKRMENLGGWFELKSKPESGTQIRLGIKLK